MCTLYRSGTLQVLYMPSKLQVAVFALFLGSLAEDTQVAVLSRSILLHHTFIWRHYIFCPPPPAPAACAQAFLSPLTAKHSHWAISYTCCHTALCETHGVSCSETLQAKEGVSTVCTKHIPMVLGTDSQTCSSLNTYLKILSCFTSEKK